MSPSFNRVLLVPLAVAMLTPVVSAHADAVASDLPDIVVTAGRIEQNAADVAVRVETISGDEIRDTPAASVIDIVKKNASVDVIQYPGGQAGIGLRGFRPEISGTNQRVLLLIDGRPAGVTSAGNLPMAGVSRVEVLKGAASALYGSSAMGGVVNFISKRSSGPLSGRVELSAASRQQYTGLLELGGDLADSLDFDLAGHVRTQRADMRAGHQARQLGTFRQGDGVTRPNSKFTQLSGYARVGWQIDPRWRLEARVHGYLGDDLENPGPESDGTAGQSVKTASTHSADLALTGRVSRHALRFSAYRTWENDETTTLPRAVAANSIVDRDTTFSGLQVRDAWSIGKAYTLIAGADFEVVETENLRYNGFMAPAAPTNPDDRRRTYGAYAEIVAGWFDDRLLVNAGGRVDRIRTSLRATYLRPDVNPGATSFTTTNPRAGIVLKPFADRGFRLHGSVGSGFVAPAANQLAGFTDQVVGVQRRIVRGNPDLKPEKAATYDIGFGYEGEGLRADVTWFRTDVKDKIESVLLSNTTALREQGWVNASTAKAEGFEGEFFADLGGIGLPGASIDGSATYYTKRTQDLPAGRSLLRNVARFKANIAVAYAIDRYTLRLSGRHVDGMVDTDNSAKLYFTEGKGGVFKYPSFFVADASLKVAISRHSEFGVQVGNLLDKYYYEKGDYPLAGRTVTARYAYSF